MRQRAIFRVVNRAAGAHLGRNLDEVQGEHRGCGELALVRGPAVGGASGRDVVEKRPQRPQFLGRVFDQARVADYHHRAVDQRMVQRRAGKHQPVDEGGGDTDGQAGSSLGGEHRAAAGGAVQVEGFAAAGVRRRQDHRPAIADIAEMTDQRLVEDAMDDLAVVARAFPIPGGRGSCCG